MRHGITDDKIIRLHFISGNLNNNNNNNNNNIYMTFI